MEIEKINEQIAKKNEIITKAEKRIKSMAARLEKDRAELSKMVSDEYVEILNNLFTEYIHGKSENWGIMIAIAKNKSSRELEYALDDVDDHLEAIKNAENRIETANEMLEKLNSQKKNEENLEKIYEELPEIVKEFLKRWTEDNIKYFIDRHDNSMNDQFRYRTNDDIVKIVTREIKDRGIELGFRVQEKAGKINDASGLTIGVNGSINGIIHGEKGKCIVESIVAGGYNIQRLHYRVLVK